MQTQERILILVLVSIFFVAFIVSLWDDGSLNTVEHTEDVVAWDTPIPYPTHAPPFHNFFSDNDCQSWPADWEVIGFSRNFYEGVLTYWAEERYLCQYTGANLELQGVTRLCVPEIFECPEFDS